MSQKATKTWCLRLVPVLFFISFVTYYCSDAILQSYGGSSKPLNSSKTLCGGWLTQKKWESLNFNISRRTQLFLKLEDFFWRQHLSQLALPYGIKGSELLLLKVLAVTASYQLPANVEKLECRTCVVIGNGFAIKNSSLGSIINKYDVVIRLNDAPVRGYEEDVGNKTTMRFFYPESASYNPGLNNEPGTLMVLVPFKQQDLRWLKEILYDEKRVRKGFWKPPPQIWLGDISKIRVLDPHFLHQTAERLLQIPLHPKTKQVKDCFHVPALRITNLQAVAEVLVQLQNNGSNQISNSKSLKLMISNCGGDASSLFQIIYIVHFCHPQLPFSHWNLFSCLFPFSHTSLFFSFSPFTASHMNVNKAEWSIH